MIGVPAFVRRAKAVENAIARVKADLEKERKRLLEAHGVNPERFNTRWLKLVGSISLEEVHAAQEAYNRYYAIEREMALPDAPRMPFTPQDLFDRSELLRWFPLLGGA